SPRYSPDSWSAIEARPSTRRPWGKSKPPGQRRAPRFFVSSDGPGDLAAARELDCYRRGGGVAPTGRTRSQYTPYFGQFRVPDPERYGASLSTWYRSATHH